MTGRGVDDGRRVKLRHLQDSAYAASLIHQRGAIGTIGSTTE
jgi:hypothetical protein